MCSPATCGPSLRRFTGLPAIAIITFLAVAVNIPKLFVFTTQASSTNTELDKRENMTTNISTTRSSSLCRVVITEFGRHHAWRAVQSASNLVLNTALPLVILTWINVRLAQVVSQKRKMAHKLSSKQVFKNKFVNSIG